MKEEDYNKVLIRVKNTYAMPSDIHDEKLIFKMEKIPVFETEKLYKSINNERILKTKLLKPTDRYKMMIPEYEVFCLPGDEEQAAEIIRKKIEPQLLLMLDHLQGIVSAIKAGVELLESDAHLARNIDRSEQNMARRAAIKAGQISQKP
jgi:hypothetical protein